MTFDARETPGDKVRYKVDYGDGNSSVEALSTHIYENTGTFTASLTVTDAANRTATVTHAVVVKSLRGTWFHAGFNEANAHFEVRRLAITVQDGHALRGTYSALGSRDRGFTGQIDGDRMLKIAVDGGAQFVGTVPNPINADTEPFRMSVHGDTADGQTLPFLAVADEPSSIPPRATLLVRYGVPDSPYAIVGLDNSFDSSGSAGDGLSHAIEFGDGQFASGPFARHAILSIPVNSHINNVVARAVVVDRFGRAAEASATVPVVSIESCSINDSWYYHFANSVTNGLDSRLLQITKQQGRQLTGQYTHPERWRSPFTGTLRGMNEMHVQLDDGTIDFSGTIGFGIPPPPVNGKGELNARLLVRGGSASGQSLLFWRASCY